MATPEPDPIPRSLQEPLGYILIFLGLAAVAAVLFAGSMAIIWALHTWPSQKTASYYDLKARIEKLETATWPARKDE